MSEISIVITLHGLIVLVLIAIAAIVSVGGAVRDLKEDLRALENRFENTKDSHNELLRDLLDSRKGP